MSGDTEGHLSLPSKEELARLKGDEPQPRKRREWVGPARPTARARDRQFVPGALRHWRKIHGLTQRQAGARIGLGPSSNSWSLWETGQRAPTYENLLKILACTGLGFWVDHAREADIDPTLRLEVLRHRHPDPRGQQRSG